MTLKLIRSLAKLESFVCFSQFNSRSVAAAAAAAAAAVAT